MNNPIFWVFFFSILIGFTFCFLIGVALRQQLKDLFDNGFDEREK